jgi:hypothetical protein
MTWVIGPLPAEVTGTREDFSAFLPQSKSAANHSSLHKPENHLTDSAHL